MSGYVTVYQKDYPWPARKPYFPRVDLGCVVAAPVNEKDLQKSPLTADEVCKQSEDAAEARLGPCPHTETIEFSPTDTCLKKLLDDNPNLLHLMPKKPSLNALKKFNLERLKSTYQADYNHAEDQNKVDLTGLPEKRVPCPLDDPEPPVVDCRVHMSGRAEMFRRKRLAKKDECAAKTSCTVKPHVPRRKRPMDEDQPEFRKNAIPAWTSEYREQINKTGLEIAKELSMSKRKREILKLKKLLKPRMICNNNEPEANNDSD
ncbi:uncharacterized protein LOC106647475 [Copidosoma floridanum]|uniref:uncharacterized protein LOC106647475 n=1 Tax=Copidosoma floridanum TaxID=29053 RepID=UPI0006C944AC|nr:uncharacterized protein LOC106647475 [Copidosoma floridanum]